MKHTAYANLVLVSQEDLNDTSLYHIQGAKERLGAIVVGYDILQSTAQAYFGVVNSNGSDLKFSGTENTPIVQNYFTLLSGTAFTRFNPASLGFETPANGISTNEYDGGERIYLQNSSNITIKHNTLGDPDNYVFLVYVEMYKNKKYDESGVNSYFVDREDAYVVVQLTAAEVQTMGSFLTTPTGKVVTTNVAAPQLDPLLNNDEKTASFGGWSYISGIFTISNLTVTHYNAVFLGKVSTVSVSPYTYRFFHTLSANDPIASYTLARPQFSVVDQYHRNRMGLGTETNANPHAMSLTDLDNYNNTIVDHRNIHHSSGIVPKFTTSLECVSDGTQTPDAVVINQIAASEYLFLQGKRVTSITNTNLPLAGSSGTYFIYVQTTSGPVISSTSPYESYTGTVFYGSTIPANAFVLCSVYWDNGTQTVKAYQGDTRYSAASTTNPVNDLRVFGVTGYDKIHSTLTIGQQENLIFNGNFEVVENNILKGWDLGVVGGILPVSGSSCLKVVNGTTDGSLLFPLNATVNYAFRFKGNTSETGSATYQVSLILYRGKDKVQDRVGSVILASGSITYSSWTLVENEFLGTTPITWVNSGIFGDPQRSLVGWGRIEISCSSGSVNIDDLVIRPKIDTYDLENQTVTTAKIADLNVTTAKIADQNVTTAKIADGSVTTTKIADGTILDADINAASGIGRLVFDGTGYTDSGGNVVGSALKIAFASTNYYIPSWGTPSGPTCGCTCTANCGCTGTCGCTCTCKGTSWN